MYTVLGDGHIEKKLTQSCQGSLALHTEMNTWDYTQMLGASFQIFVGLIFKMRAFEEQFL